MSKCENLLGSSFKIIIELASNRFRSAVPKKLRGIKYILKGLSHEIDFKNFDKNLQNLA
jgi:hypothetical protein